MNENEDHFSEKVIFNSQAVDIQLSYLNDEIHEALCNDLLGILVFIICQKAFDKIGCTKLTQKFKVVAFP